MLPIVAKVLHYYRYTSEISDLKPRLLAALFFFVLSSLSSGASALVVYLGDTQNDIQLGYESITSGQLDQKQLEALIKQNPNLGIKSLERYFIERGDLTGAPYLAPRLIEKLPNNGVLQALYALSLAAKGDLHAAKKYAKNSAVRSSSYHNLVQAMIFKAEDKLGKATQHIKLAQSENPDLAYNYNVLGNIYSKQGKYKLALKQFEKARRLAPLFIAAHANIGASQYLLGKRKLSAAAFTKAIQLNPELCKPRYGRAIVAESMRLYNDAITDLQFCLKKSEELFVSANKKSAELSLEMRQLTQALKYSQFIKSADEPFFNRIQGEVALRQSKIKEAIGYLKQANQKNLRSSMLLATAYALDGDYDNALKIGKKVSTQHNQQIANNILTMVIEVAKNSSTNTPMTNQLAENKTTASYVAFLRGIELAAEGKAASAITSLKRAEGFFQGFSIVGISATELGEVKHSELPGLALGSFLHIANMPGAARSQFENAVQNHPNSLFGLYFSALAAFGEHQYKIAAEQLNLVLKQAPKFFAANYLMAETQVARQEHQRAVPYYEKAANVKDDAGVLVKLGLLNEHIGHTKAAENAYKQLVKKFPEFYVGYNQLAWLYAKDGTNLDEGIRLAQKANKLQQDNISINDTLGWLYYHKKDYKIARKYLEKANQLSGRQKPDVLYHLAVVQNAMGDKSVAKANLQQAFSLAQQFDGHEEARRLLSSISQND